MSILLAGGVRVIGQATPLASGFGGKGYKQVTPLGFLPDGEVES
jgi:hypothetical protein